MDEEEIVEQYKRGCRIKLIAQDVKSAHDVLQVTNGLKENMSLKEAQRVVEQVIVKYLNTVKTKPEKTYGNRTMICGGVEMDEKEIGRRLQEPFPPECIEWRVGRTNEDKTRGLALAYSGMQKY